MGWVFSENTVLTGVGGRVSPKSMQQATPTLDSLHDIVLPEPVSWMPGTAAWWVVLGAGLLLLGWASYVAMRRRRASLYRRLALESLGRLETMLGDPAERGSALSQLPVLVKRTALAYRPRAEVAALSGEPWLQFLDESYGGRGFTAGPGRLLPALAYESPGKVEAVRREEITELVGLLRQWIRRHRVRV